MDVVQYVVKYVEVRRPILSVGSIPSWIDYKGESQLSTSNDCSLLPDCVCNVTAVSCSCCPDFSTMLN